MGLATNQKVAGSSPAERAKESPANSGASPYSVASSRGVDQLRKGSGSGKEKTHHILVVDRAGWHTAKKKVKVPGKGYTSSFLPPHSPELQPAERLWPLSNEGVANSHFEELEETLGQRCVALSEQPDLIRSYIRYHWWPKVA